MNLDLSAVVAREAELRARIRTLENALHAVLPLAASLAATLGGPDVAERVAAAQRALDDVQ